MSSLTKPLRRSRVSAVLGDARYTAIICKFFKAEKLFQTTKKLYFGNECFEHKNGDSCLVSRYMMGGKVVRYYQIGKGCFCAPHKFFKIDTTLDKEVSKLSWSFIL